MSYTSGLFAAAHFYLSIHNSFPLPDAGLLICQPLLNAGPHESRFASEAQMREPFRRRSN